MAIFHLSTKLISRGQGRSATAAAAYRSGELVHGLTTDEVFDYTRKRGVEHTEIVSPTAAAKMDINWARDRESLWNAAELAEERKDARVAREYEVAPPPRLCSTLWWPWSPSLSRSWVSGGMRRRRKRLRLYEARRDQLQASTEDLKRRGAQIAIRDCGPQKRLCVQVGKAAGTFGTDASKDVYMIAKRY